MISIVGLLSADEAGITKDFDLLAGNLKSTRMGVFVFLWWRV